ncbi:MAG: ADP-forming succinate--CoA ligase subunit beta [Alphaproteobacteria bacterium]|nr:ADP-forming succinate--CoA ligase subunit beta [Alphaproteobacteria bacterium]
MNLHEYQAKELMKKFGVNVPNGIMVESPEAAEKAAKELGTAITVVKAQVHTGGRGKVGGVKVCKTPADAKAAAAAMLGEILVTKQTGPQGLPIHKVYVEEGSDIVNELYFSIMLDRETSRPFIMASSEGGMDIEEVAEATPEKILNVDIDPMVGLMPYQARDLAFSMGLTGVQIKNFSKVAMGLWKAFDALDADMVEINPLVVTGDDQVIVLDTKLAIDGNALFRHPDLAAMDDHTQQDSKEVEAAKHDLNYVALDGTIGCMVNGAGLAMATMDIIKHYGESPANFLDVGGGATEEKVTAAFKIILSDPNVNGILVNIFGGIMKCDVIAKGVVAAAKEVKISVPLVVRLEGTNVDLGKQVLAESGLPITPADSLDDAAKKIIAEVRKAKAA